jgi:hypothetical protein
VNRASFGIASPEAWDRVSSQNAELDEFRVPTDTPLEGMVAAAVPFMIPVGGPEESAVEELPVWVEGARTRGWLNTGRAQIELWSGESGGPAALPLPGRNSTNFFHVEAHAAQIMRTEGLDEASLFINKVPCSVGPGCANNLPHMLPEGATLYVYGPDGYVFPFRGLPDPPGYP